MSLIKDTDLRKILKIKEDEGEWLVSSFKLFFGIDKLNQLYNENLALSGLEFIDSIINKLGIRYSITEEFEKRIPSKGPFIIIANHPLGGLDGLLLLRLFLKIRPDFRLQGNFLVQNIEAIKDFIIPVNPFENFKSAHSSYKGLKSAYQHLKEGGCLGIFPAGEVSSYQLKDFKITDRQWQKSSIRFIKTAGVPVIPVYFHGFNSTLFYLLGQIHPILRTAKLPSELLNKSKQTIEIEIRKPLQAKTLNTFTSITGLSHYLRAKTYSVSQSLKTKKLFQKEYKVADKPKKEIIDPVRSELILSDLSRIDQEHFLFSTGSFSVYCAPYSSIPHIMREIGRLREITFREVGEGTNKSIDLDQYDLYYNHLIIWDNINKRIAGSYRIGKGKDIMAQYGRKGFYISSLFRIKKGINPILEKSFELGRSFIIKEYQRHPLALFSLWKGILWYLMKNPDYQYLIGPVSISNDFSGRSKSLIVQFLHENYFDNALSGFIKARKKFKIPYKFSNRNRRILDNIDDNLKTLDLFINELQPALALPILMKKYLQMNGKIIGFNIDPGFNDCLDCLMMVNIADIPFEMLDNMAKELEESSVKERFKTVCIPSELNQ
jgi:putative hemolysin